MLVLSNGVYEYGADESAMPIEISTMYPECIQIVSIGKDSIGKDRLGEDRLNIYSQEITEIISYLNEIVGSSYKTSTKKTRTLIASRLKEGFTVNDLEKH